MVEKIEKEVSLDELFLIAKGLFGQIQFLLKANEKMANGLMECARFCQGIDMALRERGILGPEEIEMACRRIDAYEKAQKKKPKLYALPARKKPD